jgi:heme ABC exporter ATP-binding subunit CcmA
LIEVEKLTVVYGRTLAIDEMDVAFGPGVTGLFGPNGSGKSTLLRAIAGLLRPTSGRVTIGGEPTHPPSESLRARIGYAGHAPGLYAHLTVAENLELFATLHGVPRAQAVSAIAALALEPFAGTPAGSLSAGLAQRAGVARALLNDPEILLLDEPYANLDDDSSERVSAVVKAWVGSQRIAIVATHGAKRVKAYADAGVVLKHGRVAVAGHYAQSAKSETP